MFMIETNYKAMESSPHDDVSYSDVENVSTSPTDNTIDDSVIAEQIITDDRSSIKGTQIDESKSWTMAKVQVGYDVTRKGERSLVVDGFKFTKSRDGTNNRIFWRCSRRECKATAVTVSDRVEHVRAIHAHEPPLAAEFFGSHEGVLQHCELQEVRFNTNAANMRPRYRKSNVSMSESNPDESLFVKDISNSTNNTHNNTSHSEQKLYPIKLENTTTQYKVHNIEIKPAQYMVQNSGAKTTNSVKDQVRDFILRNSSQMNNYPQNNGVSVAQFLIAPAPQSQFIYNNNNNSNNNSGNNNNNNTVTSSISNSSTAFNFNPMYINNGSDSTSDISSHKSTPGLINAPTTLPSDNAASLAKCHQSSSSPDYGTLNPLHVEQILQMLLKNGTHQRQRSCSDSEWSSPTPGPGIQQSEIPTYNSPSATVYTGPSDSYQTSSTSRFVHWKKERLCETEKTNEQFHIERKRRYENSAGDNNLNIISSSTNQSSDTDTKQLCSFLSSVRPVITKKLTAVIQKLTSELCPEEAVAQEVFEKCTAIRTCLETLEKLHSLTMAV